VVIDLEINHIAALMDSVHQTLVHVLVLLYSITTHALLSIQIDVQRLIVLTMRSTALFHFPHQPAHHPHPTDVLMVNVVILLPSVQLEHHALLVMVFAKIQSHVQDLVANVLYLTHAHLPKVNAPMVHVLTAQKVVLLLKHALVQPQCYVLMAAV